MSYEIQCQGAASVPVNTGSPASDCTTAGGSLTWVESAGVLPDLSLSEGGLIAGAILALWAVGWSIRAIRNMIEES